MVDRLLLCVLPEQPHHLGHSRARGFAGFPNAPQVAVGKECGKPPLGCLGVGETKSEVSIGQKRSKASAVL